LHFLFEDPESLIDIVVANEYLQNVSNLLLALDAPSSCVLPLGRHPARCATNKAKIEYLHCTRFPQGLQPRDVIENKRSNPLDNRPDRAHGHALIGHKHMNDSGAGGRETSSAPMWTILFGLTLAAAVCFGVSAVALAYSKYLARLARSSR
jgi:hypothetical protein